VGKRLEGRRNKAIMKKIKEFRKELAEAVEDSMKSVEEERES
jgi:hypothetical protein